MVKKSVLFLLLAGCATLAAAEDTLSYRKASYVIARAPRVEGPSEPVTWAYPVVTPTQLPAHRRLNAWLRGWALESLAQCASTKVQHPEALPDRRLVEALSADPDFAACELEQAVIEPKEAFGPYAVFTRNTASLGQARVQYGVDTRVFDLSAGTAVDLPTLFKPGALEALNAALAEQISEDSKRPDCRSRVFKWTQVSLRPPADLFIEFPYDPAEWGRCGDGIEALHGRVVAGQLAHPARLRPLRRWVQQP